jgi:hypothetical protein
MFGRDGEGPGEFRNPSGIRVDTLVRIRDPQLQRAVFFDTAGTHIRTIPYGMSVPFAVVDVYDMRGGVVLLHTLAAFSPGRAEHRPNALLIGMKGIRMDTIARFRSDAAVYRYRDEPRRWGIISTGMGSGGTFAVLEDSIVAVADGLTGRIDWYSSDESGLSVSRVTYTGVSGSPQSQEDVDRALDRLSRQRKRPARQFYLEQMPPYRSAATTARFTRNGDLWLVGNSESGESARLTRISADGATTTHADVSAGFRLLDVTPQYVLATMPSTDGLPRLRLYRILN